LPELDRGREKYLKVKCASSSAGTTSGIGVDDFLVVLANNGFHVFRAAVTYFDVVLVEDSV
jgi:hypothetical protein